MKSVTFLGVAHIAAGQRRHTLWELLQQGLRLVMDADRPAGRSPGSQVFNMPKCGKPRACPPG
jgi:hypothetical protein